MRMVSALVSVLVVSTNVIYKSLRFEDLLSAFFVVDTSSVLWLQGSAVAETPYLR